MLQLVHQLPLPADLILAFLIVIVMSYKLSQGPTPVPSFHVFSGEDTIGNTILSIILVQVQRFSIFCCGYRDRNDASIFNAIMVVF